MLIACGWLLTSRGEAIGAITVEGGMLRLPIAPEAPGIYRFDLSDRVYIGGADRLRRRFQHTGQLVRHKRRIFVSTQ